MEVVEVEVVEVVEVVGDGGSYVIDHDLPGGRGGGN